MKSANSTDTTDTKVNDQEMNVPIAKIAATAEATFVKAPSVGKQAAFLIALMVGAVLISLLTATGAYAVSEGTDALVERLLIISHNGEMQYSEDNGASWTTGTPDGVKVTTNPEDGTVTVTSEMEKDVPTLVSVSTDGSKPQATVRTESGGLATRAIADEDGQKTEYSTDGGVTWTTELPEGVTIAPDGAVTYVQSSAGTSGSGR